jgi:hypothetical protein
MKIHLLVICKKANWFCRVFKKCRHAKEHYAQDFGCAMHCANQPHLCGNRLVRCYPLRDCLLMPGKCNGKCEIFDADFCYQDLPEKEVEE